ncbi:MAG: MBL fold metallo-hydrolase, partial [Candidatus Odinarchaeota archaeon]
MVYEYITPKVLRVYEDYRSDIGFSNSYLILGEQVILVDAGLTAQPRSIIEALHHANRDLKDIKYILLTHAHPDILGGLNWLSGKTGATVCCSRVTADMLANFEEILVKSFNLSKNYNLLLRHKGISVNFKSLKAGRLLEHRNLINLGGEKIIVVESGGHCNGHLCYWIPGDDILFSGDELYCHPNNRNMIMIDRTGSVSKREYALEIFRELQPKIICQAHDIPVMSNIDESISEALEIQKCWRTAVLDYLTLHIEADVLEIENYVFKCFNVKWDSHISKLENHSTILKILEFLEEAGYIQKSRSQHVKEEKIRWSI